MKIPFNKPCLAGQEVAYAKEAILSLRHCGNQHYTDLCKKWFREKMGMKNVFFTPSCTDAMEMGTLLFDLKPGDEVILPSYTFSSTANAIVLRGAKPVFCEVKTNTMNIDVDKIESLITSKTKVIMPIDYAGIPCEIDRINHIAKRHSLFVMLDAAQSLGSRYQGKPTGLHSHLAAFSMHETKNVSCGEGGCLVVNEPSLVQKAHFVQEKGTDRSLVLSGVKSKYWWIELGSSFLLSNISAAVLLAQLEYMDFIIEKRKKVTSSYVNLYSSYADRGCLAIPHYPKDVQINHHAFFVIFDKMENRELFLARLREKDVNAYIGYMPLHSSPMGRRFGYHPEDLPITEDASQRIVRLPFYTALADEGLDFCIASMRSVLKSIYD